MSVTHDAYNTYNTYTHAAYINTHTFRLKVYIWTRHNSYKHLHVRKHEIREKRKEEKLGAKRPKNMFYQPRYYIFLTTTGL